jgi:hypothetical protein
VKRARLPKIMIPELYCRYEQQARRVPRTSFEVRSAPRDCSRGPETTGRCRAGGRGRRWLRSKACVGMGITTTPIALPLKFLSLVPKEFEETARPSRSTTCVGVTQTCRPASSSLTLRPGPFGVDERRVPRVAQPCRRC